MRTIIRSALRGRASWRDLTCSRDVSDPTSGTRTLAPGSTEARAALAGSLLESLDTEVDEDTEAAWATEVNRRLAELDSGAVKTIPWVEVRHRLAAR